MMLFLTLFPIYVVLVSSFSTFLGDSSNQEISDASTPADSSEGSITTSDPPDPDFLQLNLDGNSDVLSTSFDTGTEISSTSSDLDYVPDLNLAANTPDPASQPSPPADPQLAVDPSCHTDEPTGRGKALLDKSGLSDYTYRRT